MNVHLIESSSKHMKDDYRIAIELACSRVAPLFDIRDMVAVNPFLGFAESSFFEAALDVERIFHEEILPAKPHGESPVGPRVHCVADRAFTPEQSYRRAAPLEGLTKFLSVYLDEDASNPWRKAGNLYLDYKEFARVDRSCDSKGLRGYRKLVARLPDDAGEALESLLAKVDVSKCERELYLSRLLARLTGYAGLLRARAFLDEENPLGDLPQLLAILLFQDFALAELEGDDFEPTLVDGAAGYMEDRRERYRHLREREAQAGQRLASSFSKPAAQAEDQKQAQLVFCIDVRSERYRRNLERSAPVETYGFAGFFGIPMAVDSSEGARPHCPALLAPQMTLASAPKSPSGNQERREIESGFFRSLTGPISSLCTVEAWGITYVSKLLADTLPNLQPPPAPGAFALHLGQLSAHKKIELAQSILRNTGLSFPLAPLVVFVGHTSHVTNNAQAAGLACGACAGHSGSPNAQVAAALLNDQTVRQALSSTPYAIEDHVLFLAAEHETVTDSVNLVEPVGLSATQQAAMERLKVSLAQAGQRCREERKAREPQAAAGDLYARTHDYAETQPEWGLAGNAAFLIGDRSISRGATMNTVAFMHSYDEARDEDGSILEMILTAPAVVTSWINLQYYASTVAPRAFGSGRKTLHNPVGRFGVIEGGQGDLAVGLSRESVFIDDESGAVHEPLRMHLMVQARPERIRQIVEKHESLRRLVSGEWIFVSALVASENGVRLEPLRYSYSSTEESRSGPVAAE